MKKVLDVDSGNDHSSVLAETVEDNTEGLGTNLALESAAEPVL